MRTILHCDLNNFFASVECRDNPDLRDVPIAVCGNEEERKGIVLAKNDLAKAFGVKTGEAIWEAKLKCRDLQIVHPHFNRYMHFSKEVYKIYTRYTDMIEPFGIDECWLDVTGSERLFGTGEEIAYKIKETVKKEQGLRISVGVSFNKIFAKLGSDMKKPDAVTVITSKTFKYQIWNLPASEILGVGKATKMKLDRFNIRTIGDIANSDEKFLIRTLGVSGTFLKRAAMGMDDSPVKNQDYEREVKSVGNSTTCIRDLQNNSEVWRIFLELSQSVCHRLREQNLSACGIQITIRNCAFETIEFQQQLEEPLHSSLRLAQAGFKLFLEKYIWEKKVRMLGIRAIALIKTESFVQENFFIDTKKLEQQEKIDETIDTLEKRYGTGIVTPLTLKIPLNIPDQKNKPSFFH